jgi:hypothetical protein
MPSIQTFNDFMQTTGPTYLTSADAVINEAVKNTYAFSRLLKNKASEVTVQGGNEIRDVIMFDDARTYDHYQPNDVFTWRNPQVTDTIKAPWRFSIDHMSWTDAEVELNTGESAGSTKVAYKRLKKIKEQRLWTSMTNGFEEDLWAPPSNAQMEVESGRLPYSLPTFITGRSRNLGGSLGQRGLTPMGFTNVMGLDPTVDTRWTNLVELYVYNNGTGVGGLSTEMTAASTTEAAVANSEYNLGNAGTPNITYHPLFTAFDNMFMRLKYEAPATRQQYFENDNLSRQMILTSREGVQFYRRQLRLANDTLVNYQDSAYNNPVYSGIDVTYCSDLDTAAVYTGLAAGVANTKTASNVSVASADTLGSELGSTTYQKGPRYYFVNGAYLTPIFHSKRYFKTHEVLRHPNQPFTYVMPVDCWHNLFCNSRQRHGIVAPFCTL